MALGEESPDVASTLDCIHDKGNDFALLFVSDLGLAFEAFDGPGIG